MCVCMCVSGIVVSAAAFINQLRTDDAHMRHA